ncbi:unnamed protein product [Paramecium octaurelia]|uniref:Uncharacterized protein n=1 Tax=Paramecium octaurelia TaxID=43137 RepID=A0A8S1SPJ0_PAROT|nr:unnamed protein product [Paramecium octaurelia]
MNMSTKTMKSLQQSTYKHQLLSDVFSDFNFYKYRSQSNTEQYTPLKGFQIVKLRGPSRVSIQQSQQSIKTVKSIKKRNNSQNSVRIDLFKHVTEMDDYGMHEKLMNLFEIDLKMRKNLEINRMIVQDKQQSSAQLDEIYQEILLMLSNTIERIHQYINANNLERSDLKKAQRRTAIEIEHQLQEFVNMMLTAIAKRDMTLARLTENAWKLICVAIEMILQNGKAEQEYIQQEVLNELQQEVVHLKQENEDIYHKYMEVSELNNKLTQQHKQEINILTYQLNMARVEFNDYKQSQEALGTLEHATGSLKDVELNLKDTHKILNKIEENISNRDTQLFQTLKSVVQQHKMDKDSQMNKSQKLINRYQLKSLNTKQCIIASEYFNHPFVQYLDLNFEYNQQDEKCLQQLLVDWFNQECVKPQFGTHPAQQRLEQISTYERKSNAESFIHFLIKNDNLNQLQNCIAYISQNIEMGDLNSLNKVEKYSRQLCIFFGVIFQFDINNIEIDLLTYDRIRFLYSGLMQTNQEEQTQNQNKFQWYNFVVQNLSELCAQIFLDYSEKVANSQQTIAQILVFILQSESDKRKHQLKKLIDDFKSVDIELNLQRERMFKFVKELCSFYNYQYNELQVIQYAQALFDRYIRVYQTGRKRNGLEIGEWISFIQELQSVLNKLIQIKPHLHHQIFMLEDLQYVNKEFQVHTRTSQIERRESQIRKK